MERHWEIRAYGGEVCFAVGRTELDAWLNLFLLRGKCFTVDKLLEMVHSVKLEGDCIVEEIVQ
ncbi:MAG: hypothetical protein E6R03_04080 [Hyphomicrobiaceae bacterium]|nr:MAG: hypothetical protein E6R03_04080 [Hyphomicrobiaceae bacterium]